ncbi:MAG TPA: hypothetical protein VGE12_02705 [Noviherbaspirillum sp.]
MCGIGFLPFRYCCCCGRFGAGAWLAPLSAQSSVVDALAADVALPVDVPEADVADADAPVRGVTVTVDPSGMVVVPVRPSGPTLTLLDMSPDGGAVRRDEAAPRSPLASGSVDRDAALAALALEVAPFPLMQDRLALLSADAPKADDGKMTAAHANAPSASMRSREV